MNEKLIFATLLAAILAVTIAPTAANIYATSEEEDDDDNGNSILLDDKAKPPTTPNPKNQICDPKVNVKAIGDIANGTTYIANLDGLTQVKVADQNGKVNFHFDFKVKKPKFEVKPSTGGLCFGKDTVIPGDVQGNPFEVLITKKTTTVSVTIPPPQQITAPPP